MAAEEGRIDFLPSFLNRHKIWQTLELGHQVTSLATSVNSSRRPNVGHFLLIGHLLVFFVWQSFPVHNFPHSQHFLIQASGTLLGQPHPEIASLIQWPFHRLPTVSHCHHNSSYGIPGLEVSFLEELLPSFFWSLGSQESLASLFYPVRGTTGCVTATLHHWWGSDLIPARLPEGLIPGMESSFPEVWKCLPLVLSHISVCVMGEQPYNTDAMVSGTNCSLSVIHVEIQVSKLILLHSVT